MEDEEKERKGEEMEDRERGGRRAVRKGVLDLPLKYMVTLHFVDSPIVSAFKLSNSSELRLTHWCLR